MVHRSQVRGDDQIKAKRKELVLEAHNITATLEKVVQKHFP